MSAEFWAILGVGVAVIGLHWRSLTFLWRLHEDVADVKQRLARIEGWIEGRFREGMSA